MSEDEEERKKMVARAARAAADLKETEDLLAGFDRPGRTPRTPVVRDFVDFHLKKGSDPFAGKGAPGKGASPVALLPDDDKRGLPTFVLPRESKTFPSWLSWALAMVAMIGGAATFAWCIVSSHGRDDASGSTPSTSAATTISAGSAVTSTTADPNAERNTIPPPPPPSTVTDEPTPTPITTTTLGSTTVTSTTTAPSPPSAPRPSNSVGSRPSAPVSVTAAPPTPPSPSANPEFIRNL